MHKIWKMIVIAGALFAINYVSTAELFNPRVLIIMGASCSGKSSLSSQMIQLLGDRWKLIELDVIEEQCIASNMPCSDDDLVTLVIQECNEALCRGYNVVVDTNIYSPRLHSIAPSHTLFILVSCPLLVLLERNKKRDKILQRDSQRSQKATEYVIRTFQLFNDNFFDYDIFIDSSLMSIKESIETIFKKMEAQNNPRALRC